MYCAIMFNTRAVQVNPVKIGIPGKVIQSITTDGNEGGLKPRNKYVPFHIFKLGHKNEIFQLVWQW